MELVIFAGGRGIRCGELTSERHKGAIPFRGMPLIHHVLGMFAECKSISRALVVTGYQRQTIHDAVAMFAKSGRGMRVDLIDGPDEVIGTCRRLAHAIPHLEEGSGCLMTGIDSLFSAQAAEQFVKAVHDDQCLHRALLLSPQLDIAPTHHVASVREGFISEMGQAINGSGGNLFQDVGLRYLPQGDLPAILRDASGMTGEAGIARYLAARVASGGTIRAVVMSEAWRHFGNQEDFLG